MTKLAEHYGFPGRVDFSDVRGGLRRPLTKRDGDFPYDRELKAYGQPDAYDRGSGKRSDDSGHPIVPKDTDNSIWDEIGEVTGYPALIGKSNQGDGSGRTIPGTSGDWANAPFDDEVSDEELDAAADDRQVSSRVPLGRHQFHAGRQGRRTVNRESKTAWSRLKEAFVSLKDTPEGQMALSKGVKEAELEDLVAEFSEASDEAERKLAEMDEEGIAKFIIDLDPDHAAKTMASSGRDSLMGVYKTWRDRAMGQPNDAEIDGR